MEKSVQNSKESSSVTCQGQAASKKCGKQKFLRPFGFYKLKNLGKKKILEYRENLNQGIVYLRQHIIINEGNGNHWKVS